MSFPAELLLLALVLLSTILSIGMVHGIQAIAAAILFLGVAQMRECLKPGIFWTLIALQLILSFVLVVASGYLVGAHLA